MRVSPSFVTSFLAYAYPPHVFALHSKSGKVEVRELLKGLFVGRGDPREKDPSCEVESGLCWYRQGRSRC